MAAPDLPPRPTPHPGTAATLLALGVLLVALGATGTYSDLHPVDVGPRSPWLLLPLAVTCLAVLGPPRRPLAGLLVGTAGFAADAVLGGTTGVLLAYVTVLYWSSCGFSPRGRGRVERAALTLVLTGSVAVAVGQGSLRAGVGTALSAGALLLVPLWWARDVVRSREVAQLEVERARAESDLVVRSERAAMARDLHDVVAGHLSAIALQSEAGLAAARARGQDTAVLAGIRAASVESLQEMRTMIHLMRDAPRDPAVAPPGLDDVPRAVEVARASGLDVRLRGWEEVRAGAAVAPLVGQGLHRVLQEALTNARKHAGPGPVHVRLARTGDEVVLEVRSAAPVPAAPAGTGHGLATMAERVAALDGRFAAGPAPGGGWAVRTAVPAAGPRARVGS